MSRKKNKPQGKPVGKGEKAKDVKGTLKKLFHYMGNYRILLAFIFLFAICGTLFNIVGPKILGMATTEIFNGLVRQVSGTGGMDFAEIGKILLFTLSLYVVSGLCSGIQGFLMGDVSNRISYRFRRELSEKINRMPMNYFDTKAYGDILSRVTNDVDILGESLSQCATQIVTSLTTLIGVLVMMLSISVSMTLLALLILPVSVLLMAAIMKHSQKYFRRQQEYLGKVNGHVEEVYGGHNIVKVFNKEEDVLKTFDESNDTLYDSAWRSQFLSGLMMPLMSFVGNLGYVGVSILGGFLAITGKITVGEIQSFIQYVRNFMSPIQQMAQIFNMLQSAIAAAERVFEFLEVQGKELQMP